MRVVEADSMIDLVAFRGACFEVLCSARACHSVHLYGMRATRVYVMKLHVSKRDLAMLSWVKTGRVWNARAAHALRFGSAHAPDTLLMRSRVRTSIELPKKLGRSGERTQ